MNKKLILVILFLSVATGVFAQSDTLVTHHIKALENYALNKPVEKVHLHLDRQIYFPGDTIWFKAYVVLGGDHKLSAFSGMLYAELIGPKDSIIKRITLGLSAGTAPGDFEIPYNALPGTYRVRAYTNWMRNFGPEYFFNQRVTVAGFNTPLASTQITTGKISGPHTPDKIDLQFFPEGGDLVNGLRSKIAFKAINQNGIAEEVQGSVVDNSGNEVATFTSQHLGMGVFPLEPQNGKLYVAKITAADGSIVNVPLPVAKNAGLTLTVNDNLADSLYIKVAAANVPDTAFYLIAQSGGKEYFAAAHKLQNSIYTASVAKNRFPTGIVQFTLFAQNGEPLNERIVFIQNDDQLKLTLTSDKQTYAPGDKVKFEVQASEPDGTPATGAFSVAVIDENKAPVNEITENTIFTDLLLKSEISGYVQDPNYYFIEPNDKTKADLDLLMLTQGYRRFEWKQILNDRSGADEYQPERGFSLSGTVTTPAGKPVLNGQVILTSTKNMLVLDTLTDANGKFAFRNLILPDTAKVVANAKKANGGSNVLLTINKPAYPAVTAMTNEPGGYIADHYTVNTKQIQQAYTAWRQDSLGHVIQLKEVKVKDHQIPPYHPDYSILLKHSPNLNGPGKANQVIMGDQLMGCPTLSDCLHSLIRQAVIWSGSTVYSSHTPVSLSGPTKPMAVLVDGVILSQRDAFKWISASDIQSIEVLSSHIYTSIYGSAASGGLLIITTKLGDEPDNIQTSPTGLIRYGFNGLYKARNFYTPKYVANQSMADNRQTIYWNADLTAQNGKSSFEYPNAGSKGNYRVVIEGIDSGGRLARQVLKYRVDLVQ